MALAMPHEALDYLSSNDVTSSIHDAGSNHCAGWFQCDLPCSYTALQDYRAFREGLLQCNNVSSISTMPVTERRQRLMPGASSRRQTTSRRGGPPLSGVWNSGVGGRPRQSSLLASAGAAAAGMTRYPPVPASMSVQQSRSQSEAKNSTPPCSVSDKTMSTASYTHDLDLLRYNELVDMVSEPPTNAFVGMVNELPIDSACGGGEVQGLGPVIFVQTSMVQGSSPSVGICGMRGSSITQAMDEIEHTALRLQDSLKADPSVDEAAQQTLVPETIVQASLPEECSQIRSYESNMPELGYEMEQPTVHLRDFANPTSAEETTQESSIIDSGQAVEAHELNNLSVPQSSMRRESRLPAASIPNRDAIVRKRLTQSVSPQVHNASLADISQKTLVSHSRRRRSSPSVHKGISAVSSWSPRRSRLLVEPGTTADSNRAPSHDDMGFQELVCHLVCQDADHHGRARKGRRSSGGHKTPLGSRSPVLGKGTPVHALHTDGVATGSTRVAPTIEVTEPSTSITSHTTANVPEDNSARWQLFHKAEATGFDVCVTLSKQLGLHVDDVKRRLEEFHELHAKGNSTMTTKEWNAAVRSHCDLDEDEPIPEHLQHTYWGAQSEGPRPQQGKSMSFEDFLIWSMTHEYSEEWLVADHNERHIRRVARENDLFLPDVEKAKKVFDSFDTTKDGYIGEEEFKPMLLQLMHVQNPDDVSDKKLQRYWREVDNDRSGAIGFDEFVVWYLTRYS